MSADFPSPTAPQVRHRAKGMSAGPCEVRMSSEGCSWLGRSRKYPLLSIPYDLLILVDYSRWPHEGSHLRPGLVLDLEPAAEDRLRRDHHA